MSIHHTKPIGLAPYLIVLNEGVDCELLRCVGFDRDLFRCHRMFASLMVRLRGDVHQSGDYDDLIQTSCRMRPNQRAVSIKLSAAWNFYDRCVTSHYQEIRESASTTRTAQSKSRKPGACETRQRLCRLRCEIRRRYRPLLFSRNICGRITG